MHRLHRLPNKITACKTAQQSTNQVVFFGAEKVALFAAERVVLFSTEKVAYFARNIYTPTTFDCYQGQGSGILADGEPGNIYSLNVGGGSAEACYFNDCTYGIYMRYNIDFNASNNTFNNIGYQNQNPSYGIYGKYSAGANKNVSQNYFERLDNGVAFLRVTDADVIIEDNHFNSFYSVPTRQGDRAITLWDISLSPLIRNQMINKNMINHYQRGISLVNQQVVNVEDNSIMFDGVNPTSMWYGIRVLGGFDNKIIHNSINRMVPFPDLGLSRSLFGITIERSSGNVLIDNNVANLGSGIRFFNTLTNEITCNGMAFNVDNLVLEASIIGDQGEPGKPANNVWNINPNTLQTTMDHGNILNIGPVPHPSPIFYVENLSGYNPAFGAGQYCPFICPFDAVQLRFESGNNGCVGNGCTDPGCEQEFIERMIQQIDEFANLPDEQSEEVKAYAYEMLARDSMLMYQGTILDAVLQDFYQTISEGNYGAFDEIVNLLQQEDTIGAIIVNSIITPENLTESNQQLFNEIFFATWGENKIELDAYQQSTLEFIAFQNPYSGGDAVYSARVMLGLDIADFMDNSMERRSETEDKHTVYDQGVIVPNPNTGKMIYLYSINSNEKSELQIFNARGTLIRNYSLPSDIPSIEVDLSDQTSGIYVYRVVTNGTVFAGNKIILQR